MSSVFSKKVKVALRSFDHVLLNKATKEILQVLHKSGVKISGPVPLPRRRELFVVNRSPHVDKKSRQQFERRYSKILLYIENINSTAMESLQNLQIPSGVHVEVK